MLLVFQLRMLLLTHGWLSGRPLILPPRLADSLDLMSPPIGHRHEELLPPLFSYCGTHHVCT